MEKLLQLLLEEAEREERSYWYTHGYEVEERAAQTFATIIKQAQYRLEQEK